MTNKNKSRVGFGPFLTDLSTCELWKCGVRIKLGPQPFAVLAALLERPGELVTRGELRKRLWAEDTYVDFGHGLNAAINKLREALSDSAQEPRYVETLARRGYRFIGKIEDPALVPEPTLVSLPASAHPADSTPPPVLLVRDEWQPEVTIRHRGLSSVWAAVALLVLLAALGARFLFEQTPPNTTETAEKTRKALAEQNARKPPAEEVAMHSPSIWRVDLANAAGLQGRSRVVSTTLEAIGGPQPSPDGKKLVYMTGSTDATEIWVSNIDGSSPQQLTNQGRAGTPRWSPDSRWIVFDSDSRLGHSAIYLVPAEGGPVRGIVQDDWNNAVPSWSRDAQWIYFASDRDSWHEENQVFRIAIGGGQLQQVTTGGGFSAYESLDGRTVYYAKSRYENPEIWEVPVSGGEEKRVSSLLRPTTWANWSLTSQGILFLSERTEKSSTLEFFDFATQGVRPLGTLENASFWLASSLDGKSVWYSELTEGQAHLVFKAGMD